MADAEKVIKAIEGQLEYHKMVGTSNCYNALVLADALELLKSKQAEIERLKAQKQKWLQSIADNQLAVSPTGYETEEGLAKRTGEWNGLQMAWEILTKDGDGSDDTIPCFDDSIGRMPEL